MLFTGSSRFAFKRRPFSLLQDPLQDPLHAFEHAPRKSSQCVKVEREAERVEEAPELWGVGGRELAPVRVHRLRNEVVKIHSLPLARRPSHDYELAYPYSHQSTRTYTYSGNTCASWFARESQSSCTKV